MKKDRRAKSLAWGEAKQRVNVMLTQFALDCLDQDGEQQGLTRSEILERLVRQEYAPETLPETLGLHERAEPLNEVEIEPTETPLDSLDEEIEAALEEEEPDTSDGNHSSAQDPESDQA
jgi:hypothetical protein